MTISELIQKNNDINEVYIYTTTNVRGKTITLPLGSLNVIRNEEREYMSLERKQGIDVCEIDFVLHWTISTPNQINVEIPEIADWN